MFCQRCGCDLPEVAKFCVRCGSRTEQSMTQGPIQPAAEQVPQEAVRTSIIDSRKAEFPDSESPLLSPRPYAVGKRLIVPRDAVLPDRCVKCANPPAEPWLRKTFSWHHPGIYVLIISPILYIIVALIVRKRVKLAVPLCDAHKSIRRKRLWTAAVLLLGCIPLPIWMAAYINNDAADAVAILLGVTMFIVGLVFLLYGSPLRATYIGPNSAEFAGASPKFLAALTH